MKRPKKSLVWILSAALLLCLAAGLRFMPLRSPTPRRTGIAFAQAVESNDQAAIRTLAIGTDEQFAFIGGMSTWTVSYQHYEAAFAKAFAEQTPFLESSQKMVAQMEGADQTINGDRATLTAKSGTLILKLRKLQGEWKLELSSLCDPANAAAQIKELQGLAAAYDASTQELQEGNAKTAIDARIQLKRRIDAVLVTGYRYELKPEHKDTPTTVPAT